MKTFTQILLFVSIRHYHDNTQIHIDSFACYYIGHYHDSSLTEQGLTENCLNVSSLFARIEMEKNRKEEILRVFS